METQLKAINRLRQLERHLAEDEPFGDWRGIVRRTMTFYHRASELLAERVPAAGELAKALDRATDERRFRVLGDPVVRDALSRSLEWLKTPAGTYPSNLQEIIAAAVPFAHETASASPLESAQQQQLRLGTGPTYWWVWTDERPDEPFGRHFRAMFSREIAHSISSRPAVLRTCDERLERNLIAGSQLLDSLLPDLARSVRAHVHLVAIVDVADRRQWGREIRADLCQNVSTHAIPGTIFLSPSPLRSPWHAAEALLHEAAHKKLSDLVLTRSIFRPGFTASDSPTIRAVWNSPISWNSNDWSVDRALFAFHVYVHLALFFLVVDSRAAELGAYFGSPDGMNPASSIRAALDRASYLGSALQRFAKQELGPDGNNLLDWLNSILEKLHPAPPRDDPTMQLWLDRYDRETREIGALISQIDPEIEDEGSQAVEAPYEQWPVRRIVHHLVHSEIVAAYRVLSILGETNPPSFSFYDGDRWSSVVWSTSSFSELALTFQSIRTFISRTLRAVPPVAFERTCHTRQPKSLREITVDMIEHAYRHVDALVTRLRHARGRGRKVLSDDSAK